MPCARPPVKEVLPSSRNRHRLLLPSVFERQFDSAGHRNTLFPRHCSPMAISLSTVTGTQLIAAFARFSGIRVKVSAAIHAVCLRVSGRLTLCLCGIRNDRNDTYRKASNQAHGNLRRAMGRRAILSKDRRAHTGCQSETSCGLGMAGFADIRRDLLDYSCAYARRRNASPLSWHGVGSANQHRALHRSR